MVEFDLAKIWGITIIIDTSGIKGWIIIGFFALVFVTGLLLVAVNERERQEVFFAHQCVKTCSERLTWLDGLSQIVKLMPSYNFFMSHLATDIQLNSKREFDNFAFDDWVKNFIKENDLANELTEWLQNKITEYNRSFGGVGKYSLQNRKELDDRWGDDKFYNFEKIASMEREACHQFEINMGVKLSISYASPQGRNYYHDSKAYSWLDLIDLASEAKQEQLERNQEKRRRMVSPGQRQRILRRDHFTCQLCGARGPGAGGNAELEVDHRIPFSLGGTDDDANLWTLCWDCNRGKGNKYED